MSDEPILCWFCNPYEHRLIVHQDGMVVLVCERHWDAERIAIRSTVPIGRASWKRGIWVDTASLD